MLTNLYLLSVFGHTQVSPFFLICIPGQDSQTDRATVSGKDKLRLKPLKEAHILSILYTIGTAPEVFLHWDIRSFFKKKKREEEEKEEEQPGMVAHVWAWGKRAAVNLRLTWIMSSGRLSYIVRPGSNPLSHFSPTPWSSQLPGVVNHALRRLGQEGWWDRPVGKDDCCISLMAWV